LITFKKTALDQVEYLKHLRRKNLEINNDIEVINHLNSISHFRLSADMHTFYQPNDPEKKFIAGTNFNDVIKLYLFDKNLRLLILNPIESIEIALRTQVANALAKNHGPLGYLNPKVFDSRYNHQKLIELVTRQSYLQNSDIFKKNYTTNNPKNPLQTTIWMAVEFLTFKEIST
jgi:abortive infection bacteriophage resistance protein